MHRIPWNHISPFHSFLGSVDCQKPCFQESHCHCCLLSGLCFGYIHSSLVLCCCQFNFGPTPRFRCSNLFSSGSYFLFDLSESSVDFLCEDIGHIYIFLRELPCLTVVYLLGLNYLATCRQYLECLACSGRIFGSSLRATGYH